MNPVALEIGPITIHWYGILASCALLTGYLLGLKLSGKYGISADVFDRLFIVLVPAIVIGARAAYVVANWAHFLSHPFDIIRLDQGGLGSHGAILLSAVVGYFATRALGASFWDIADALSPAIPVAYVLIRIGNFTNGELYGAATDLPWGMVFPGVSGTYHPTMVYDGVLSLLAVPLSLRWATKRITTGTPFLRTILVLSAVRFMVDFTRPRTNTITGLLLTQIVALALALVSAYLLQRRQTRPVEG